MLISREDILAWKPFQYFNSIIAYAEIIKMNRMFPIFEPGAPCFYYFPTHIFNGGGKP